MIRSEIIDPATAHAVGLKIDNPFASKESVQCIRLRIERGMFNKNEINFTGSIECKVDGTEGTHRFEAPDFDTLLLKLKALLDGLPK